MTATATDTARQCQCQRCDQDFEALFREALRRIDEEAKAVGSSLTEVCREAHISRTTPDRWRLATPATIRIISRMQQIVRDLQRAKT